MVECVHQCLECKTTFSRDINSCPNCGSHHFCDFLAINDKPLEICEGSKRKEGKGKGSKEFLDERRISRDGIEVKQSRVIDKVNNRYIQSVKKQNEKGEWIEYHREDEPLSEHHKKASKTKKP
jgi:hypothetical protein